MDGTSGTTETVDLREGLWDADDVARFPGGWPTAEIRFAKHVARGGGCWEWRGARDPLGYGRFGVAWRYLAPRKHRTLVVLAHRFAWVVHHRRPVPAGMVICHACDNPRCVNPAHLWLGTLAENSQDMVRKGRARNPCASVTHCPAGHAYDASNTYRDRNGKRSCKTCKREHLRASRQRRREHVAG